jgi:hypothetical protein
LQRDWTISFGANGYVTFENLPASVSEVFDQAENAMYRAQASGKSFAVSA